MRPTTFSLKLDQSAPYNITKITVVIFRGGDYFTLTSSQEGNTERMKAEIRASNIDNFHY